MTNLKKLTSAFSALSDTELKRLDLYEQSGKKFFCGKDAEIYCRDNLG